MVERVFNRSPGLSGFQIKLIALILMVIDHVGEFFAPLGTPVLLRWLGRLSAPLFCYMVAEGYSHTRSVKKYLLKLYAGFLAMGVGNFLLMNLAPRSDGFPIQNNIFGLFFLAVLYMFIWDKFKGGIKAGSMKTTFLAIGLALVPFLVSVPVMILPENGVRQALMLLIPGPFYVEGNVVFLFFSVMIYILKDKKAWLSVFVIAFSAVMFPFGGGVEVSFFGRYQWMMGLSLPFMLAYNGKRGFGRQGFFYLFYPAHVWGLYLISRIVL